MKADGAPALIGLRESRVYMDTVVTIELSRREDDDAARRMLEAAFSWFGEVESVCSRFDPNSELRRLIANWGRPVEVSPLLFHAIDLACRGAEVSKGAFDPTVGPWLERAGFTREHRTGRSLPVGLETDAAGGVQDIELDRQRLTVHLRRPVLIDLGGVAKGLALDLAARELVNAGGFAINAGGDVLVSGSNPEGEAWRVGIRHPREAQSLLCVVALTDGAVCTSGDYERQSPAGKGHHIIDPATGVPAGAAIAATVIGPSAAAADMLATAALVLGPEEGLALLHEQQVEGLLIDQRLTAAYTRGFQEYLL